ncbi:heterodisulfide reductase-related iron-sulfur binding cluster [Terriglobus albidus]|uniref:heterodisulfide reductase-related iron-sulfur binding cluster n=1 Tax=Terriglobus albidus TaxID=1592106 RepID=UPI0021E08C1B|nr:heterodisulfide reductase-related iron-sulfur binding cluster [Terriglobus albidus]
MLPPIQKLAFLLFAVLTIGIGLHGFYRVYRRIAAGRRDTEPRFDHLLRRIYYSLVTTLTQQRTFWGRPFVSLFHSFIFYGFVFYLIVNMVDLVGGFFPFDISSATLVGRSYNLLADSLSTLILIGVVALVIRRFLLPSRGDFSFNERTLLHQSIQQRSITLDSILVSVFILFHVGSRAIGAGAKMAGSGADRFQPFASLLSHLFSSQNAESWRIFGYWGSLGSVLLFWMYFPRTKHIHIFMAPAKYLAARTASSGVLPSVEISAEQGTSEMNDIVVGANKLEDFAWPRLLDAYACIQCNRCQDVCPATATGKALSPSALEINKRMELNELARSQPKFETGEPSPKALLTFALSPEAAWACTTCGACMEVCPVQDEPMLDIIDVRRHQVMMAGEFPRQLQAAFRGMERAKNPWGISQEKRLEWAEGLAVKTIEENPEPEVLFWVGCAASYDPQAQKTARAFVKLLQYAGINFAVLGKRECCTGDSARRAGNEYLYRQLAEQNIDTLNACRIKLIVATCPHCLNALGGEYRQLGGNFKVMHHTEYLASLVTEGKLTATATLDRITYHDPCYLGRHNGIYDEPRKLLKVLGNGFVELERTRENSFCCGAGGAQFWKEEEPGTQRVSENRYNEAARVLGGAGESALAVGCPFCKSMLGSTPGTADHPVEIKDIAELLLAGVEKASGMRPSNVEAQIEVAVAQPAVTVMEKPDVPPLVVPTNVEDSLQTTAAETTPESPKRPKWNPKTKAQQDTSPATNISQTENSPETSVAEVPQADPVAAPRKKWTPKRTER